MKSILVNGKKVSYIDVGVGEVILLLHGWATCKEIFLPTIKELSKNFHVIALDLPGFGDSESIDEYTDLNYYVDFLVEFMKSLDLNKATLFGSSMGGGIVLLTAKKYPGKVKSLIVSAPLFYYKEIPGIFSGKVSRKFWVAVSKPPFMRKVLKHLMDLIFFKHLYPKEIKNAKGFTRSKLDISEVIRSKFLFHLDTKVARDSVISCLYADFRHMLKTLNTRTLILWNRKEGLLPSKWAKVLHKLLPDSQLKIIDDSPHSVLAMDEKVLAESICKFLLKSDKIGTI